MDIIFFGSDNVSSSIIEYKSIWQINGDTIVNAFTNMIGLPFLEKSINGRVDNYKSNFAGTSITDEMKFRANVRFKLGTLFHELSHRLLIEYKFKYDNYLQNDHEFIDLFFYDVMVAAFGKALANERVTYERTFPEKEIVYAWDKILKLSLSERQSLLKKIISETSIK